MKRIFPRTSIILLIIFTAILSIAQSENNNEIYNIVHKVDQLYRSKSSYSELEMEIVTPHWERTLSMKAWTEGTKKTFIRITAPKKEKGVATLRIGNEMWNYLPKTNKVVKIPPSMMMSSWMGSDFTNDDLVKEFSLFEDYSYEYTDVENPQNGLVYINCIPREDLPVVWGNIVMAVTRSDTLPVWQKYYDEKGELMRVLEYDNVNPFDGRKLPSVMVMIPQNEEGHRTTLRYEKLEFNIGIDEEIFSLRNLRKQI
ncbi:MAG: outer membrane lipoprotein-sorting protein [candidate division Zixibacteria bacterium]|nr:outer membrane lipoprotein-sorting protein [candidate division Zixibacteria bacterium]